MSRPRVKKYRIRKQCLLCFEYGRIEVTEIRHEDGRVYETHRCLRCGGKKGVAIR